MGNRAVEYGNLEGALTAIYSLQFTAGQPSAIAWFHLDELIIQTWGDQRYYWISRYQRRSKFCDRSRVCPLPTRTQPDVSKAKIEASWMDEFGLEAWQREEDAFACIAGGYSSSILKIQQ